MVHNRFNLFNCFQMPRTAEEWIAIAQKFEEKCNFLHCLGAVDGKHVRISPPPGSESYFYNYKHFHSVVLMACVNANFEFIWVETGTNGKVSDGGVLKNTEFYDELNSGKLNLPYPQSISDSSTTMLPFVFVGDEAFALRTDFMKPFGQKTLNRSRRIFNYRLSRARRMIENVFGILANRFRIFHSTINLSLENIDLVVLTCCILLNFYLLCQRTNGNRGTVSCKPTSSSSKHHIPEFVHLSKACSRNVHGIFRR